MFAFPVLRKDAHPVGMAHSVGTADGSQISYDVGGKRQEMSEGIKRGLIFSFASVAMRLIWNDVFECDQALAFSGFSLSVLVSVVLRTSCCFL